MLADYIIHNQAQFRDVVGLELGAGCGLCGFVLSRVASRVYITGGLVLLFFANRFSDYDDRILDNVTRNIGLNSHLFQNERKGHAVALPRVLDWRQLHDSLLHSTSTPGNASLLFGDHCVADQLLGHRSTDSRDRFYWTEDDQKQVRDATILIASDGMSFIYNTTSRSSLVIYDESLTNDFFGVVRELLRGDITISSEGTSDRSNRVLYLALEKRVRFMSLQRLFV